MSGHAFSLEFSDDIFEHICAHGRDAYPIEACGLVLGKPRDSKLLRAVRMKNVQDRYHQLDPEAFPRDGRDAFRLDELQRMKLLESCEAEGLVERVLYHSHCDAGAYFSPEDRAMAFHQGVELMPGVIHVVVSVRDGEPVDMAAFKFEADTGRFVEERLWPRAATTLPDLELRAMEGKEAARPIKPVGPALSLRRLSPKEWRQCLPLAEGRKVPLERSARATVDALALGLLSPLTGFLRRAEIMSIEAKGRLVQGTPWFTATILQIDQRDLPPGAEPGSVVALVDESGADVGLMALAEVELKTKGRATLAGPIYAAPAGGGFDAAACRAELLRRGANRVVASLGDELPPDAADADALIVSRPVPAHPQALVVNSLATLSPWLAAAALQNCGATNVYVEDAQLTARIRESLAIEPYS